MTLFYKRISMFGLSFETIFFILIILGLTIYFVLTYTKDTKQRQQIATHAPTILTTIGIFATFFAIAVGLSKFDTTNIQQGVPALLNALKTAFWASVVGVGGAITIKVISYIYPPEEDDNQAVTQLIQELKRLHNSEQEQGIRNQHELLTELQSLHKDNNNNQGFLFRELHSLRTDNTNQNNLFLNELKLSNSKLDNMVNFLKENEQHTNSILEHIKHLYLDTKNSQSKLLQTMKTWHEDSNTHFYNLVKIQEQALNKIAEMGTKTLIEALKEVIRDFNNKITEQFGENFKQLNEAVGRTLIWQQQYKTFIDDTSQHLTTLIDKLDTTTENFEQIVDNSTAFTETAEELADIIKLMEGLNHRNTQYLNDLVTIISDKERGLPSIEQKLIAIVEQTKNAMQQNNQLLKEASQATNEQVKTLNEGMEKAIKHTMQQMENNLLAIVGQIQQAMQENNKLLTGATQETKDRIQQLNEGMEKALTDALKQITGNLSALSEKFAQDYTPIANQLERLVQLAKQNR